MTAVRLLRDGEEIALGAGELLRIEQPNKQVAQQPVYAREITVSEPGTRDHAPPARPSEKRHRQALVVAFPISAAAPIPAGGAPIGRDWLRELGIADAEASGKHAIFTRQRGGSLEVSDAGSRNGTWVDGARLGPGERARVGDGTVLRIGRTLMVVRERLAGTLEPSPPVGAMVGPYGLRGVRAALDAFARTRPANVLIVGETGTGKELAAAAVAQALARPTPVAVNLGAVSSGVFESQLFGHVAGAFSDARKASRGVVLSADGGAVFFDEIGELPLDLQPKLLRLLENREVQPVGAERPVRADVAIVAATNRDLGAMVEAGAFRRDLLARLSTAVLELPPLRDRVDDLFAVAQTIAMQQGLPLQASEVEVEAIERLMLEGYAANVRELASVLARARVVDPAAGLRHWAVQEVLGALAAPSGRALTVERVKEALHAAGGNESEAARTLNVSRGALRRFLAASVSGSDRGRT